MNNGNKPKRRDFNSQPILELDYKTKYSERLLKFKKDLRAEKFLKERNISLDEETKDSDEFTADEEFEAIWRKYLAEFSETSETLPYDLIDEERLINEYLDITRFKEFEASLNNRIQDKEEYEIHEEYLDQELSALLEKLDELNIKN